MKTNEQQKTDDNQRKHKKPTQTHMKTNEKTWKPKKNQRKQQWQAKNNTWILLRTKVKFMNKPRENQWEPQKNQWKNKEGTMKNNGKPRAILPAF